MDYTFEDYLDAFLILKRRKHFSASVQSTYFTILAEFHLRQFPKQISMTGRELAAQAGLRSVSSVHEAKNVLKNNRLIDFHNEDGVTIFELCCRTPAEQLPNKNRTRAEHQPNSGFGETFVCYAQNTGASAEANAGNAGGTCDACNAAPPAPSPTPPPPNPQTTSAISLPAFSSTQGAAHTQDTGEQEAQAIADVWREMTGKPLGNDKDVAELRALDNAHGREIIKVALAEHVRYNGRSFAYFKACLNSTLARLKRGERDGRKAIGTGKQNNSRKLEKPDYSNYPFYKKEK